MSNSKPQGANRSTTLWVIQNELGRQVGPMTTEEVLSKISSGNFSGKEKIKRYPEGKWISISREPQFYDRLLEVLESSYGGQRNKSNQSETSASSLKTQAEANQSFSAPVPATKREEENLPQKINKEVAPITPQEPVIIELKRIEQIEVKTKKKALVLPLAVISMALVLVAVAIFWPNPVEDPSKPRLLYPKAALATALPVPEQKERYRRAIASFTKDTFESYIDAQNQLVSLIEGAPLSAEPRGLLCLVYRELWPFVRQDSQDLEAVLSMTKATRGLDPGGVHGIYCEISKLMVLGKYRDARGLIDHTLNTPELSSAPVLFSLKAEILAADLDVKSAALYAETASKNWPQWVKAHFQRAIYLGQSLQDRPAVESFRKVLELNPKHRAALIEYGSLLFLRFQQTEHALTYLSAGVALPSRISRPIEAKGNFNLAKLYAKQNQQQKAVEHAQQAFALNPGDVRYKELLIQLGGSPANASINAKNNLNNELVLLGDQYSRSGDFLSAQAEYKAAFEIDPKNAIAAMKAAKSLWQLSQAQEAILWLNKAVRADPRLAMAYYLQADFLSQRFNYQGAVEVLNAGSKLLPNNYEILRGYGLVEIRRNNNKDAIAFLQRALKQYDSDVETLILLAKANGAVADFQKAQTYIMRAIELDGTNNEAQVVYAKIMMQYQGVDAALYYIRELISKFSYTVEFRIALAEIYKESDRFKQATEIYQQVIEADPRNKKAFVGLGESLKQQAQFDRALKAFLDAAVLDPSDSEPLFKAGQVYLESARYSDAIRQFQRALTINPNFPLGHFYIGKAALLASDYELALSSALEERRKNPSLSDPYLLAADVYMATREYQKCSLEYQQAVKLRPLAAEIYVKMARCLRLAGSLDVAESMLNIASAQESGLPDIYKELGAIFEQRGDRALSTKSYCKYLGLSPNAPDKKEVEARIEMMAGSLDVCNQEG